MHLNQTLHTIKNFFAHLLHEDENRSTKTKKYTRHMIKKYGKTLRKLSKE